MDEQAAIVCLGCPSGTKKSADGRVVCGQAGFEETLVGLLNANKAMIGAWFCAVTLAALGYLFIRRRFPECEAFLYLEAVFSMIETILDAVFLNLLRTSGLMKHFAIGVTGFSCHFVINSVIVGMFLHHEFRSSHVRRWAEKHVSVVPAAVMLSVMNPELLGLMSSRLGPITYTHAPFSPKSLAALQFSTFVAFVAGKTPQLCVELLILSSDGWHLDPFLASVTTLILLVRGILHFLIYYILQLYRKRRGARGSARSSQTGSQHSKGGSKLDVAIRKSNPYSNDIERLKVDLSAARKRVLELEEIMQLYLETPADYEQPRMPTTEILATAVISAPLSRRPSSIANRGDLEFKVPA
ncbi:hypothetical protein DFS34DRAFT_598743 [Phlyctochytrium arcticum]|nr:hypothetical protein DFS34DRAFT_598743 [Phlyctochytrium arcticum]